MKYFTHLLLFAFFMSTAFAVQLVRIKSDTPIYKKSSGESSKGELYTGDNLSLLKKGKDRSLVKSRTGLKGWVPNSNLEYIKASKGDFYKLQEQEIHGWLDNPSAIYILDESGLNTDALPLNRSFRDEIFERQDREEIERGNDEN